MRIALFFIVLSLLLVGCTEFAPVDRPAQDEVLLCAADVMICPDGTFVTRDPANECNYKLCSEEGYGDTAEGWRPAE